MKKFKIVEAYPLLFFLFLFSLLRSLRNPKRKCYAWVPLFHWRFCTKHVTVNNTILKKTEREDGSLGFKASRILGAFASFEDMALWQRFIRNWRWTLTSLCFLLFPFPFLFLFIFKNPRFATDIGIPLLIVRVILHLSRTVGKLAVTTILRGIKNARFSLECTRHSVVCRLASDIYDTDRQVLKLYADHSLYFWWGWSFNPSFRYLHSQ